MNSIDRYIFRTTFGAFAIILVSLTAFIWITQALREIDLITSQGQTVLVFIAMTGLLIPVLVLIIAPIGLMIAITYALNKLNSDSEIIVLSSAGVSGWRLFMPFFAVALVVSAMIMAISAYLAPKGLRELRNWASQVRADLVTTLVKPGRFTSIERGLTFHIRERQSDGQLLGILIDDRRDPKERATFLAERGDIIENDRGTFLVLVNGSVQRQEGPAKDPTIVAFERYAFDLSRYTIGTTRNLTARERYLWELANPDPNDPIVKAQPGAFRAEFHDRLAAPLYPIVFAMLVYAFLGAPSTSRQSRRFAIGVAIASVAILRFVGFGCAIFAVQSPGAIVVLYLSVVAAIGVAAVTITRGGSFEPPAALARLAEHIGERARSLRMAVSATR